MKKFVREHYTLKSYTDERYRLDVYNPETNIEYSEFSNKWETLYMKAKKEAKNGCECSIYELKYELI